MTAMWTPDFWICPWSFAASAAIGYLMGSLPTAWLVLRLVSGKHSDIRSLGDGNVGATNAGRLMGARWGFSSQAWIWPRALGRFQSPA